MKHNVSIFHFLFIPSRVVDAAALVGPQLASSVDVHGSDHTGARIDKHATSHSM